MNELYEQHFGTPFFSIDKPEWVEKTNKLCQTYLDEAHDKVSEQVKKEGSDFGHVYHSVSLETDPNLKYLTDFIGATAWNLLDDWGVDLSNFTLLYESMWVQEFAKDGGGHHRIHIHENSHISGFYFLENNKASYPIFHDPRPGASMTSLPVKDDSIVTPFTKMINYQPEPGHMYFFPSYLPHEYVLSKGGKFKFIHFNLQVISNLMLSNEGCI